MRFFIALEIPESSKKQIKYVQRKLAELIPQVRLTDNSKLHLTIAFVGEQPEWLKDSLEYLIQQAVTDIPIFSMTPAYIDAFPNLHHPHTFWIGVKGDLDKLFVTQERIKDGLNRLNLNVDNRRYVPHIAIAKINNFVLSQELEYKLEELMLHTQFDPIKIESIKLFESIPTGDFHVHNTLAEIYLAAQN